MPSDAKLSAGQPAGDDRLNDLTMRAEIPSGAGANHRGGLPNSSFAQDADDDVIRIEDLTPRENVKGGRKIILGEVATRPEDRR